MKIYCKKSPLYNLKIFNGQGNAAMLMQNFEGSLEYQAM